MKYLFLFLCFYIAQGVTVNVNWDFGTDVIVVHVDPGDAVTFTWTGSGTHNVAWQNGVFPTSANSNTQGHVVEVIIEQSMAGQTLEAFCGIHPSIQATIAVSGTTTDPPTVSLIVGVPTDSPTARPTNSPTGSPTGSSKAIAVNGYYPLYTTEAVSNANGDGSSHTHILNNITYYMPNGIEDFWHGNYTP